MSNKTNQAKWELALQANYESPSISLVSGKGSIVKDANGKSYLDFLGGIATNVVGHAHPAVVSVVSSQIKKLGHVSNFYSHPNVLELASKLQKLTGDKGAKVFFCNSGAEANEAALKLSRKSGKYRIVATEGAFHGRTMGALSLTGQPSKREPFFPLLKGISHVPFGDLDALRRKVTSKTAMVIIEPIQGEAGVVMPPVGYLKGVREICDTYGALFVIDAVQTGMGRTGQWFGYEYEDIRPDVITLAKGLGGGLPLGAMIALSSADSQFSPGDHGTTFGANPVVCAAALAAIKVIEKGGLLKKAKVSEAVIKKSLADTQGVKTVRGQGLLLGIVLDGPYSQELAAALAKNGVLVNAPNPTTIRIAPALTVTPAQVKKFIAVFKKTLSEVTHGK